MELTFLGTAGWMPSDDRETACVAVRVDRMLVLLDAGTGVRRLVTEPSLLADVDAVQVLLSHFHLDHVVGLTYLSGLSSGQPVEVFGPGSWLYGTKTEEILGGLVAPPFQPYGLGDAPMIVRELGQQGLQVSGNQVHVRAQRRHSAPTVGMRLGDSLAYVTDTAYDPATADFASGVQVLLHEAFAGSDGGATHSSATEAARVASDARCGELSLIHTAPRARHAQLLADARTVFPRSSVGHDRGRILIE